mgnify:CR=1 FL=1
MSGLNQFTDAKPLVPPAEKTSQLAMTDAQLVYRLEERRRFDHDPQVFGCAGCLGEGLAQFFDAGRRPLSFSADAASSRETRKCSSRRRATQSTARRDDKVEAVSIVCWFRAKFDAFSLQFKRFVRLFVS